MKNVIFRLLSLLLIFSWLILFTPTGLTLYAEGYDYFESENGEYYGKIKSAQVASVKERTDASIITTKSSKDDNYKNANTSTDTNASTNTSTDTNTNTDTDTNTNANTNANTNTNKNTNTNISPETEDITSINYIATFNKNASNRQIYLALNNYKYRILGSSKSRSFVLEGINPAEFLNANQDILLSLEPDRKTKTISGFEVVNDTLTGLQWAVEDLNLKEAWEFVQSETQIKIAVIDTGIFSGHEDFENTEILAGWDFVYNRTVTDDAMGHGTMVTGVIAATAGNFKGTVGISQNCTILPLQIFTDNGYAYDSDIVEAIYFAADSGCRIINMSYGGAEYTAAENKAIQYALSKNCILIAAAGNSGKPDFSYPASYDGVISVGSYDENLDWSVFSTFNNKIDISAPGEEILLPAIGNGYEIASGTSFAAPQISGIAALALSVNSGITPDSFMTLLQNSSIDLGSSGYDIFHGYGKVDTVKLLENAGGLLPAKETSTWLETGNYDISWYNPTQSSFYISNPQQLAGLSYLVNEGITFSDKTIYQTSDIDLGGHNWIPIGFNSEPAYNYNSFGGSYDGKSYEITNMTVDIEIDSEGQTVAGLFGRIIDGKIKNTIIGAGSTIKFTQSGQLVSGAAGGIAGLVESDFPIENCHSSADIYVNSTDNYVGGIAGSIDGDIIKSTNSGNIISHNNRNHIGGIAGLSHGGIYSSYNKGNIMGYGLTHTAVGGIAGFSTGIISETYNAGDIIGTSNNTSVVGGITGSLYGDIYRTYNKGKIHSGGYINYAGGIAGTISGTNVQDSINYGDVQSSFYNAYVGGISGRSTGRIINSQNDGVASSGRGFMLYSGGITGSNSFGVINNCVNTSNAIVASALGSLSFTAGISGENTGEILNSSNQGFVYASNSEIIYLAGISADNRFDLQALPGESGTIRNSFNTGYLFAEHAETEEGTKVIGGIAAYNDGKIENCYNGLSIFNSNNIVSGDGGEIAAYNSNYEDELSGAFSTGTIANSYSIKNYDNYFVGKNEGVVSDCGYFDGNLELTAMDSGQIAGGKTNLTDALNFAKTEDMSIWEIIPGMNHDLPLNFLSASSISIKGSPVISVNFSSKFQAQIEPFALTGKDILWTVENLTGMAFTDQTGEVTGIKPGTVIIRATAAGFGFEFIEKEITVSDGPVVVFSTGGGTEISSIMQEPGSIITIPEDPERTGYTFVGWDTEIPEVMPSESIVITALWKINKYTITFKDWNGDILKLMEVEYESSATAPVNPTRPGYTFSAWDKSFDKITSDLIITALYKQNIAGILSISGVAKFGEIISANKSGITAGQNDLAYQWQRNGNPIAAALSSTYVLNQADIGQQITVKVSGTGNYAGSIESSAIIPAKADRIVSPTKPVLSSRTSSSIIINTVSGHEYRINNSSWQTRGTFSGLNPDTLYKVYSRISETDTHFASEISQGLDVRTSFLQINTNVYYISRINNFISKIPLGTTASSFLSKISESGTIKIFDGGIEIKDSDLISTGMDIRKYSGNNVIDRLTIIVTGDITGNGKSGLTDFVQMKSYLLGKSDLTGEQIAAGDISGDGKITLTDYIKIKSHLLGKETIIAMEYE